MKFISFALPLACFTATMNVLAAPLPLDVHLIHPSMIVKSDREFITAAATRATEILSHVSQVIKNKDKNILPIILGAEDWEKSKYLAQLAQNVHTLAAGVIPIFYSGEKPASVPGDLPRTIAAWDTQQRQLMIFEPFYEGHDVQTAAFNLIHEASHALLQTADHFSKDGRFTPIRHIPIGSEGNNNYCGYVHEQFRPLRQLGGAKVMLQNADTYLLLSHLAVNGLVDYKTSPMKNWSITGSGATASASSSSRRGWKPGS
ncbi:hypothetical protein CPB83DRAFT_902119 [Crepidotus variabilis]|uniref:Metallopeptidase n=1 Tax=Crepidotus variabilis TaxID=179855 RepID=A0A9P6ERN0_9AGAR|nr:hypothetical protein CPB83DRAFT_902119 [Crepidotus variabilis]